MVALMQTMWHTTGKDHWYRATRFFGTAFLINFAMGVVTGIVQEFQFGRNWSDYSRFVGDVFGAPLAFEGLAAFFFESILLGSWIFDWGRLPKALHLASIWIVATAVNVSAYFIIVASSFMQHPRRRPLQPGHRSRGARGFLGAAHQPHRARCVPPRRFRLVDYGRNGGGRRIHLQESDFYQHCSQNNRGR